MGTNWWFFLLSSSRNSEQYGVSELGVECPYFSYSSGINLLVPRGMPCALSVPQLPICKVERLYVSHSKVPSGLPVLTAG